MPTKISKKDIETKLKIEKLEAELKQKEADIAYLVMCTEIEILEDEEHEEINS